jgi:hypothetical protein
LAQAKTRAELRAEQLVQVRRYSADRSTRRTQEQDMWKGRVHFVGRVRRGLNTVDFGRFKNRVLNRSAASDSTVFMSPPSGFRDVVFGPEAFAFNDAGFGMME